MTIDVGRIFGRGIGFPPRVGPDGRIAWSEGETNVRESIRIILTTQPNERLRLPEFGAGLHRFQFEPNTVATRHLMEEQISQALARWEPRIALEEVRVEESSVDPEAAVATIRYRLVATGLSEKLALSVSVASS